MERQKGSERFPIGSVLPAFSLPNVDGSIVAASFFEGAQASLVVFSCNHCPYVMGSEKMLFDTIRLYQPKGLKAVLISANDPVQYPEDSFENMKKKSSRESLPCPYLFDESQQVAKKFDAACTPECFLFDAQKKLVFHGAVNNSPKNAAQADNNFVASAIAQLLEGKNPEPSFVHPLGCSIKWKIS